MGREETLRLSDFLQEKVGDRLRSVVHYDADGHTVEYTRPGLEARYTEEELETLVRNLRAQNVDRKAFENLYRHGRLNATVNLFEDVMEVHFTHRDHAGTGITMDAAAQAELYSFVGDCLTVIGVQQGEETG